MNVNDSTSNGVNGTPTAINTATGQIAGAAVFSPATSSYIDFGSFNSVLAGSAYTVSVWAQLNAPVTQATNFAGIVTEAASYPYNFGLRFEGDWDNHLTYYTNAGTLDSGISPQFGTWYYVTGVFDSAVGMKLYVNGVLTASNSITTSIQSNSDHLYVGMDSLPSSGRTWPGTIDEVRVSGTALSADWIAAEYSNHRDPRGYDSPSSQYASSRLWRRIFVEGLGIGDDGSRRAASVEWRKRKRGNRLMRLRIFAF